jgi:Family of unknown function (DUF5715)
LLICAFMFSAPAALAVAKRKTHVAAHKTAPATPAKARKSSQKKLTAVKASTDHPHPSSKRHTAAKHYVAADQVHSSSTERRKATSADFVNAAKVAPKRVRTSRLKEKEAEDSAPVRSALAIQEEQREAVARMERPENSEEAAVERKIEELATPIILPTIYNKRGRLIVPPPLKGSHEILVRQNVVADRDGLDRIQDDNDLIRMREQHLLVGLPVSRALEVDDRLPANRRYSRPWTAQFLATLARAHYARFHTSLQVNSAVRTVEFQQHLMRINGNAAPAEGETASPHLTGQAIDIAKHGLSLTEIAWLRGYLLPLIQQGRIDVEEEFQQACFHISVYKKYTPSTNMPRRSIATSHHNGTSTLAAAIQ